MNFHPCMLSTGLQYWSDDLADVAAKHLLNCSQGPNVDRHQTSGKFSFVGESSGISYGRNFTHLVWYWFFEGHYYNYLTKECHTHEFVYTCDHFHQVNDAA